MERRRLDLCCVNVQLTTEQLDTVFNELDDDSGGTIEIAEIMSRCDAIAIATSPTVVVVAGRITVLTLHSVNASACAKAECRT